MKLTIIILVQIILLNFVRSGLVNYIIGTISYDVHRVNENIDHFDPIISGKESLLDNVVDSFMETVENVNERVDDILETKERRVSSEAYRTDEKTSHWSSETFHDHNNGYRKQENIHSHFHNHEVRPEYSGSSEWKYTKPTQEYDSSYREKPYSNDNSWENNYTTQPANNRWTTSTTSDVNKIHSNLNTDYSNSKNTNVAITSILFPGAVNNKDIVKDYNNNKNINNNNNITNNDKIIFPGKVNNVERKCPDGLVITANGACLEQIVIHMGNRSSSTDRSVRR